MNPNKEDKNAERGWKLYQEVIHNEKIRRELLLKNMEQLTELHDSGLYKTILGDENSSWSAFLGEFEVFYSRSKVYNLVQIYKKFTKELGLGPNSYVDIPHSKLGLLIKIVTKENIDEWLTKARTLTNQDFEDEIRIANGKPSYHDCKYSRCKKFEICDKCGFRHQI